MKSLSKAENLDEFLKLLPIWIRIWRKRAGTGNSARRRTNQLRRQQVASARQRFAFDRLPAIAGAADTAAIWQYPDPLEAKLVLLPADDAGTVQNRPEGARRRIKRYLREAITERSRAEVDLVNAGNSPARRLPSVAQTFVGGRLRMRGLYLEAVGAAILPNLTAEEEQTLESLGARIFSNRVVTLETVPHDKDDGALHWHLGKLAELPASHRLEFGRGVTVGILDTGIDSSHSEFAHTNVDFAVFDADGQETPHKLVRDFGYHGTHVSGLCAGINCGVAAGVDLAVAAVLTKTDERGRNSGTFFQVVGGLNWLANRAGRDKAGVDIINASLTFTNLHVDDAGALYNTIEQIRQLNRVVVVAAIGNEGVQMNGTHGVPGRFDSVIGVGAIDANFNIANFSNWGLSLDREHQPGAGKPDLVAPGVAVRSAVPGNRYIRMNGSSMSAPIVSGAAAVLMGRNKALRDNPAQLTKNLMALTSHYPNWGHAERPKVGSGFLNLDALI